MQFSKHRKKLLATVAVFAIVAAACSSDKKTDTLSPATTAATATTVAGTATTTASSGSTATTTGATTGVTTGGTTAGTDKPTATTTGGSTAPSNDLSNHPVTDTAGPPVHGGTLVFGLDSDSANGWAPYRTSCAGSCFVPLQAVSDSLFAITADGKTVPLLLKSIDHNADYTQWVMHVRDGIKFHDGTPLDGAAVKFNIDSCLNSPLTGAAFLSIKDVTASGQDVTINIQGGPWVALPATFGYGQCSYMFSQKWLSSLSDIPQRNPKAPLYDATLAATPADGDPAKPVGLGAFTFDSYTPGNGNSFKATKNADYWRGPKGVTGEDLPYLDAIEAVVYVDIDSRQNAVKGGDIDGLQTANGDAIKNLLADKDLKTVTSNKFGETGYTLINAAAGPTIDPKGDNAKNPLLQQTCRQALAAAIDTKRWASERGGGVEVAANGPFPPGAIGYLEDSGYPKFDIDQAKKYMDQCLAATGTSDITFAFNTTNDPFNVESNQLVISMWNDAFGDKVKATITPIEQGQYIGLALTGTFQAQGWRNHSGTDPDQQRIWWASTSAAPIGGLALNFGRFSDPIIDKALDTIKSNADPAVRKAAAEAINKEFGAQVWNFWLTWTDSGISTRKYVNGIADNKLPDGTTGIGIQGQYRGQTNQVWCDNGKCE